MRILISAALFCLGAFLSGCTQTAGSSEITNFANYAQLEKGKSNKRDVYSAFGQPHDVTSTTSGAKWTYYYVKAEMSGGSYIPILGILIGGLDMDGTRTSFNFNENDLYTGIETRNRKKFIGNWEGMGRTVGKEANDERNARVKAELEWYSLSFNLKKSNNEKDFDAYSNEFDSSGTH